MTSVLLLIHLFVTIALIGVVLIQRSEGGGLGIGTSQGMGAFMSGRGTANLLTRATAILGTVFFALSLALALLNRGTGGVGRSILDTPAADQCAGPDIRRPRRRAPLPATAGRAAPSRRRPRCRRKLTPGATRFPPTPTGIAILAAHDAVHIHHRRRGLLAWQRDRLRGARRAAAGAWLFRAAAQARPLSQRRSGHDEPASSTARSTSPTTGPRPTSISATTSASPASRPRAPTTPPPGASTPR